MAKFFWRKLFSSNHKLSASEWAGKAGLYINMGHPLEALECCEEALRLDPDSKVAWNNKGAALDRLGKLADALQAYNQAIRVDRNYELPWFGKGSILGRLGKYQEELNCYETALKINPNFTQALFGKGTALYDLGRYEEALVYHEKALAIEPTNALGWFTKGNTLEQLARLEGAVEAYKKAVELNPHLIAAWGNMGSSLRELERYREALDCYDHALKISPMEARLHLGKGLVLYSAERYQEALDCAQVAGTLGMPEAGDAIAACLEKLGPVSTNATSCKQCGKKINPQDALYNIHINGFVCRDCALASMPQDGRDALKRLEMNPLILERKWRQFLQSTSPSFLYINDEAMPPFINAGHAQEFIRKAAIHIPVHDLIALWKKANVVHTSLTSLTHQESQDSFRIEWSKNRTGGIVKFDVHIRNFNHGILYPNIGLSGLRDVGHMEQVDKADSTSYGLFARSIVECIILAVHCGIRGQASPETISSTICSALSDILIENHCRAENFRSAWDKEGLSGIVADVQSAIMSDTLSLQRFVRIAELFVLTLEGLI